MDKQFFVYMVTNKNNYAIYTGVTNNLIRRIYEHKNKLIDGFTKKYNCNKLVWYEIHETSISAIEKEKQIKAGSRKKKIELINLENEEWKDLAADFYEK